MTLVDRLVQLVDVPSVSRSEAAITDLIEAQLRAVDGLSIDRVGDNIVARTTRSRASRVLLVGHTDTVPPAGNAGAWVEGDTVWGLGATDMKGALAAFLQLADEVRSPAVDLTYVFYAAEEIAEEHNGLRQLFAERPELLAGDVALVGEPTDGQIEAGCQGTLRMRVELAGLAAHTARPWKGVNAADRMAPLLAGVAAYEGRRPVIDGCEFREAMQVVGVRSGGTGNVVPDHAEVLINHRFAPDRDITEAAEVVRSVVTPHLGEGDVIEVADAAAGALPAVGHPVVKHLIEVNQLDVRAKLGWTDVARFAAHGIPAVNFGPGDSTLAHVPDERVSASALEQYYEVLRRLVTTPFER